MSDPMEEPQAAGQGFAGGIDRGDHSVRSLALGSVNRRDGLGPNTGSARLTERPQQGLAIELGEHAFPWHHART
jgi:hypothetical protein